MHDRNMWNSNQYKEHRWASKGRVKSSDNSTSWLELIYDYNFAHCLLYMFPGRQ